MGTARFHLPSCEIVAEPAKGILIVARCRRKIALYSIFPLRFVAVVTEGLMTDHWAMKVEFLALLGVALWLIYYRSSLHRRPRDDQHDATAKPAAPDRSDHRE